jgi:hypothetical protein
MTDKTERPDVRHTIMVHLVCRDAALPPTGTSKLSAPNSAAA